MDEKIFRKKALERIQSPENLNEYIRVASPSLIICIIAVIVFLSGALVWCCTANLETRVNVAVEIDESGSFVYIRDSDNMKLGENEKVFIEGRDYPLGEFTGKSVHLYIEDEDEEILLFMASADESGWYAKYEIKTDLEDGFYSGKIVTKSVKPISFLVDK